MLDRTFLLVYTGFTAFAFGIMYGLAMFSISFYQPGVTAPPFTVDCYSGYAVAHESNGDHACTVWSYTDACPVLLRRVNRGTCGATPAYAAVGEYFGDYTETMDIFITVQSTLMLLALGSLWVYYFTQRWIRWMLPAFKLLLAGAFVASIVLFVSTRRAMSELDTDANTFTNQRVRWGWGFVMAILYPLASMVSAQRSAPPPPFFSCPPSSRAPLLRVLTASQAINTTIALYIR